MRPFGLTKELSKSFSKPVMEYLPDLFDAQEVFDSEYEDLESLAQLASPEVVSERIKRLGVKLSADDLKERVLYNDGTRVAVAGLRFRNLDLGFPFVALKLNFRPDQHGAIATLKKLVREVFAQAVPRGFTILEKPGQELGQTANWKTLLAGSLESIPKFELPSRYETRFETSIDDLYDLYATSYEAWRESNPQIAAFVTRETKDDLEIAASKGLLMSLHCTDSVTNSTVNSGAKTWCGVIAAKSSPLFGKRGLSISEMFLAPHIHGQGLARKFQSQFLTRIRTHETSARDQFQLVWGHVHCENRPAQNTALGLGLLKIQQEYFFSLDI